MPAHNRDEAATCRTPDGRYLKVTPAGIELLRNLLTLAIEHNARAMAHLDAPARLRTRGHIRRMRELLLAFGGIDEIA